MLLLAVAAPVFLIGRGMVGASVIETAATDIATRTDRVVHEALTLDDMERGFVPLGEARIVELDATITSLLVDLEADDVTVWNRQHWVVYSSRTSTIGTWSVDDEHLEQVFEGDVTVQRIDGLDGGVLRVSIPIVAPDNAVDGERIVGAVGAQVPFTPIAARIDRSVQSFGAATAAGMVLAIVALVRRRMQIRRRSPEVACPIQIATLEGHRLVVRPASMVQESIAQGDDVGVLLLGSVGYSMLDTGSHDRAAQLRAFVEANIASTLANGDLVAHMGGDEVAILLHSVSRNDVDTAVDRVVDALEERSPASGCVLDLRAPFGVVVLEQRDGECGQFLRGADVVFEGADGRSTPSAVDEFV